MGDQTIRLEPFGICHEQCPRLLLFTGKGGVGKTTCAAAAALALAGRGADTLLLSTDPAHSVSDSLMQEIGPEIRPVSGVPHLWAVELDAGTALAGFKQRFGDELHDLLASTTYFDEEDMGSLLDLELPGLDELMGLHQICELLSEQPPRFQHVVWDSAPTGHTLRLLELPPLMDHWVRALAAISWKYRDLIIPPSLTAADLETNDVLLTVKTTIRHFTGILTDPHRSRLIPVTIPEPMAGAETLRLISRLRDLRIPVHFAIVNGVYPGNPDCAFCSTRHRYMKTYLHELGQALNPLRLVGVPAHSAPVRGVSQLRVLNLEVPPTL